LLSESGASPLCVSKLTPSNFSLYLRLLCSTITFSLSFTSSSAERVRKREWTEYEVQKKELLRREALARNSKSARKWEMHGAGQTSDYQRKRKIFTELTRRDLRLPQPNHSQSSKERALNDVVLMQWMPQHHSTGDVYSSVSGNTKTKELLKKEAANEEEAKRQEVYRSMEREATMQGINRAIERQKSAKLLSDTSFESQSKNKFAKYSSNKDQGYDVDELAQLMQNMAKTTGSEVNWALALAMRHA
jgi:hypothetical protein